MSVSLVKPTPGPMTDTEFTRWLASTAGPRVELRGRRAQGPRNPTGTRHNRPCAAEIHAGNLPPLMRADAYNWTR